ncbi:YggS family pyridoxal phosphate enzyme [Candidatus Gottesmanbacteria bacterium RIFCSPHIGHO2_02_FULL_39_14]|uniref:YggS family pyridoxal phosphate enzyme n=1 Tax=Candidatus Gottesmanbacteria bacterium RIFCSPHIGHO2_02_FULL_39_14 TaxID=1798383 RepID=A0A1F5ZYN6_9BACT|nr:MAG: YggS family pyridoxal phosphate enzyme [Candidatus Gottesmanbacteria bacterium RIFCSPHIGHO2_02_FULL_39_14]
MDAWKKKIEENLLAFYREMVEVCRRCGREEDEINILFATKYLTGEELALFINLYQQLRGGIVTIGENRVQEALSKFNFIEREHSGLVGQFRKIMIGTLQRNKINKALTVFDEIHSVDSIELAGAINRRAFRVIPVFLEVNVSGEKTKQGIKMDEADGIIKSIKKLNHIELKGLMTMAPETENREVIRKIFRRLRQLADQYDLLTSMGMSHDWQEAVMEGSEMIRIGSRIFQI